MTWEVVDGARRMRREEHQVQGWLLRVLDAGQDPPAERQWKKEVEIRLREPRIRTLIDLPTGCGVCEPSGATEKANMSCQCVLCQNARHCAENAN